MTAGAEGIVTHLCFLILSKPFAARSVTDKAILEPQCLMHIYHPGVLAVADITCIRRGIGHKHQESGDNYQIHITSHDKIIKHVFADCI